MAEFIDDLKSWLIEYQIEGEFHGSEFKTLCPFHEDSTPSLSLNLDKQVYKCQACGHKGDAYGFIAGKIGVTRAAVVKQLGKQVTKKGKDGISPKAVAEWARKLKDAGSWLKKIRDKGLNQDTIEKYLLGFDGERITIPIYDRAGNIVNIRRYSPGAKVRKMLSVEGHGSAVLYPIAELSNAEIIVVEGECKALLLNQLGYHAVSPTGGASTWRSEWNKLFQDKNVIIIFDIDKAGRRGALTVGRSLFPFANSIKIVQLPINPEEIPNGDITDYIVALQHNKTDLDKLIQETEVWNFSQPETQTDQTVYQLHLSKTSLADYAGKLVETKVIVSAKDTAPYLIPKKFEVVCSRDQEWCAVCPVFNMPANESYVTIDAKSDCILEMINVGRKMVTPAMKRAGGIPGPGKNCSFTVLETQNVEEVRLIPELEIETLENQQVVRKAYYVGHGIETNTSYLLRCKVVPEPATQYATLLVYEAIASVDSLSTFELTDHDAMLAFRPKEWTFDAIREKFDEIYADMESNVTRIYRRRNLHIFYDLVYHSVLYLRFNGKIIKGWMEGLVIGDSGQGKSETIKMLLEHYGLGEKVDAKGSTAAGLLGGLQETSRRWFVTWGVIPLNDKRLVVLEEVKGMPPEVISKLTDMRSSGIAEISKVQHAKTNARTRLIWITNPRSDVPILQFNFGVQAIPPLMGSLEDIRRLDMAIIVASGEVEKEWLNLSEGNRPRVDHVFTKELCRNLLLWTWSRKPSEIIFDTDAADLILKYASEQGERYSAQIPLVEAADHRLKLARISAAVAARTYSANEFSQLVIRPCHVEFAAWFLDSIYTAQSHGYAEYSRLQNNQKTISFNRDVVYGQIISMPHSEDLASALLESQYFMPTDIEDWTGCERDQAKDFVGHLVRSYAIRRGRKNYYKTQAFIDLLKHMIQNGELSNHTPADLAMKEEF